MSAMGVATQLHAHCGKLSQHGIMSQAEEDHVFRSKHRPQAFAEPNQVTELQSMVGCDGTLSKVIPNVQATGTSGGTGIESQKCLKIEKTLEAWVVDMELIELL